MLSDYVTQVVSSVQSFENLGTVAHFENHKRCGCAITLIMIPVEISNVKITVFA